MTPLFRSALLCTFILLNYGANATTVNEWNGKRAAVVLTYDDALNMHLDTVIPALNKHGLHATFYITANSWPFTSRISDWRKAATNGHELGNHTLFHPCAGNFPGREWVNADYDLSKYSVQRMLDEISLTSRILESVDGKQERTFAYPCGDTHASNGSFVEKIKPMFVGARGVASEFTQLNNADVYNINAFGVYEHTGKELIAKAEQALSDGTLLVYLFHGVGGEHGLNVSEQAHLALVNYLGKHKKHIWTTTLLDAVNYIISERNLSTKKQSIL